MSRAARLAGVLLAAVLSAGCQTAGATPSRTPSDLARPVPVPAPAATPAPATLPAPAAQPAKGETSTASAGSNPNDPDGKLLKKLNMDETKNADPKVNPLDALGNDLLKDLK